MIPQNDRIEAKLDLLLRHAGLHWADPEMCCGLGDMDGVARAAAIMHTVAVVLAWPALSQSRIDQEATLYRAKIIRLAEHVADTVWDCTRSAVTVEFDGLRATLSIRRERFEARSDDLSVDWVMKQATFTQPFAGLWDEQKEVEHK